MANVFHGTLSQSTSSDALELKAVQTIQKCRQHPDVINLIVRASILPLNYFRRISVLEEQGLTCSIQHDPSTVISLVYWTFDHKNSCSLSFQTSSVAIDILMS